MPKAKSKKQAGLFGAIIGGRARKKTGMSAASARKHLRGVKVGKLPKRAR